MSAGVPYLGSKISLISKSEIRYEGILYTIDTNESTVALAKVRSFGTEDRPTDRPVAPRDEVYEFIIFRGSDIKDIRVCAPPTAELTLSDGLPNDPAIVQHSSSVSSSDVAPPESVPQPPFGPVCGMSPYEHEQADPDETQSSEDKRTVRIEERSEERREDRKEIRDGWKDGAGDDHRAECRDDSDVRKQERKEQAKRPSQQLYQQPNRSENQRHEKVPYQQRQELNQDTRILRGGRGNGLRYMHSGPTRAVRGRGRPNLSRKEQLKFDSDYDFEQANAEFQELDNKLGDMKIGESVADEDEGNEPQYNSPSSSAAEVHEVFYDKAKSFFDNISCEAMERNKGRVQRTDWKLEKKQNIETFGVGNAHNRYGYRGRGGYNYRGRWNGGGNYRGGHRGLYLVRGGGWNKGPFNASRNFNSQMQEVEAK